MARIRTIKPEFFRHEVLFDAERETGFPLRVAFAGLWTACDREGRFRWAPRQLKLDCLPHDDVDFAAVLDALAARNFIVRYEVDGEAFGLIPSWDKHQVINQREAQSKLPDPTGADTVMHVHAHVSQNITPELRATVIARDGKCLRCGTINDLTVDHIFPRSIGGTHAISNLRTLCRPCNSGRPVAGQSLIDDLAKDGLALNDMERMCKHVHARGEGKGTGKEGEEDAADAALSKYFYESGNIRLSEKDFNKWREAFGNLDLKAELIGLTQWAAQQADWYFAVSGALAKKNREQAIRLHEARGNQPRVTPRHLEGII